jgi:hypothetical protein
LWIAYSAINQAGTLDGLPYGWWDVDGFFADDLDPEVNIISKLHQLQPVFL